MELGPLTYLLLAAALLLAACAPWAARRREAFLPGCERQGDASLKCLTESCAEMDARACVALVGGGEDEVRCALARSVGAEALKRALFGTTAEASVHPVFAALTGSPGGRAAAAVEALRGEVTAAREDPAAAPLLAGWSAQKRADAASRADPSRLASVKALMAAGGGAAREADGERLLGVPELDIGFASDEQPQRVLVYVFSEQPPAEGRPPENYAMVVGETRPAGVPPDHPAYVRLVAPLTALRAGQLFRRSGQLMLRRKAYEQQTAGGAWKTTEAYDVLEPSSQAPAETGLALRSAESLPDGFAFANDREQWVLLRELRV